MNMSVRKGSALLVVLGVLAVLIVSSVSFSVYMRQSRLPSSYLRRTASTRQLAKAAVARAIDSVEEAVANNPHPNIPQDGKNVWYGRVLFGTNSMASVETTVPTLTLEALAYLPPPLVNAVRYYSRMTPTAKWHHFGFDTGRYAFTAVDVSDYFDINRLFADVGRSSAPDRRVTLSYIFENGLNHDSPPSQAEAWDNFMERFRDVDENKTISYSSKFPLISLCDYNLAMGQSGAANFKSYFCDYIGATGQRAGYYNTGSEDDEDKVERQTFVTDSLLSEVKSTTLLPTAASMPVADLNMNENQPFKMADLERANASAYKVILGELCQTKDTEPRDRNGQNVSDPSGGKFLWQNYLSGLGLAALWDYLDYDRNPLSLAIPTTERHAMICGIEPMVKNDSRFKVEREIEHDQGTTTGTPENPITTYTTTVKYKLRLNEMFDQTSLVKALAVYPFSRAGELTSDDMKFTVSGIFKLFFSRKDSNVGLRTGSKCKLHPQSAEFESQSAIKADLGQISINLSPGGVGVTFDPENIEEEKDAIKVVSGEGSTSLLSLGNALALDKALAESGNLLLELKYVWDLPKNSNKDQYFLDNVMKNPGTKNSQGKERLQEARTSWRPLDENGEPIEDAFAQEELLSKLQSGYASAPCSMRLNAAIWLRVKSSGDDPKVVDMVPACFADDASSGSSGGVGAQLMSEIGKEICGIEYPLMRFDTAGGKDQSIEFEFSVEGLDKLATEESKLFKLYPERMIVADPRFNFAPEYWYSISDTLTEEKWLDNCMVGNGDERDSDIFMATSDQGYLQSIYELAFLPRFKSFASSGDAKVIGSMTSLNNMRRTSIASSFNDIVNKEYMWRTLDPIDYDYKGFEELPFASIGRGAKVNPYSDSTNVIIAAFANTPVDWRVASTNNEEELEKLSAADFNKKYAYCAYADSEVNKIRWEDVRKIAGRFMDAMRRGDSLYDWGKTWNNELDWFGASDELFGVDLSGSGATLWGADKKFLYGYWRECFAAQQQLYLLFVRAEPLMMGGGGENQVPPQLGVRAVALVWRDPRQPSSGNGPHRTRILFYRQFE